MNIPILSARSGWHIDELQRAFAERGHRAYEVRYENLLTHYGGARSSEICDPLAQAPAILTRIIPDGSLEQIVRRVNVLHECEARGVPVINSPRSIERTVDKAWTTALLCAGGLPVPETIVCEETDTAMRAFRQLGDVILKPLFGSMGLGMVRLSDEQTAWRVFRAVERIRGVFYIQRTIHHAGSDIRAFVVGGRVLAAITRHAEDWCTSFARGARPQRTTLAPEQHELAIAAAKLVRADYAGVDLITDHAGRTYVIEVNGVPGWQGLQRATGVDVAGAIAEHLLTRL